MENEAREDEFLHFAPKSNYIQYSNNLNDQFRSYLNLTYSYFPEYETKFRALFKAMNDQNESNSFLETDIDNLVAEARELVLNEPNFSASQLPEKSLGLILMAQKFINNTRQALDVNLRAGENLQVVQEFYDKLQFSRNELSTDFSAFEKDFSISKDAEGLEALLDKGLSLLSKYGKVVTKTKTFELIFTISEEKFTEMLNAHDREVITVNDVSEMRVQIITAFDEQNQLLDEILTHDFNEKDDKVVF